MGVTSEQQAPAEPRGALAWLWVSVIVVALDQASKWWIMQNFELYQRLEILPVFGLTRLHNSGAAFSFLAGASGWQRWFFVVIASLVAVLIIFWLARMRPFGHRILAAGLALVLGGAIGNVIDRVWHGWVVDFLSVHWGDAYFPAFNVADSAITVGAALLILDGLRGERRPPGT